MARDKAWPKQIWEQLKNTTAQELINALDKQDSGWVRIRTKGSRYVYYNSHRPPDAQYVSIHLHPGKTYGPKQLKDILNTIGWSEADLRHLKLIK